MDNISKLTRYIETDLIQQHFYFVIRDRLNQVELIIIFQTSFFFVPFFGKKIVSYVLLIKFCFSKKMSDCDTFVQSIYTRKNVSKKIENRLRYQPQCRSHISKKCERRNVITLWPFSSDINSLSVSLVLGIMKGRILGLSLIRKTKKWNIAKVITEN